MNIWYETRAGWKIEPVEVIRETDKSLWLKRCPNVRVPKDGGYLSYFKTAEESKRFLISRAEKRLSECEHRLEEAKTAVERARKGIEQVHKIEVSAPIDLSKPLAI